MSKFVACPLPYKLPPHLSRDQVNGHKPFQSWLSTISKSLELQSDPSHPFHKEPFMLHGIDVIGANTWQGKTGFLFADFDIHNKHGQPDSEQLPGCLLARAPSVVLLVVLRPQEPEYAHEEFVILTVQPRIAAGSLGLIELPAGMIDDDDSLVGTAVREIKEECDIVITTNDLIDMTDLACSARDQPSEEQHLPRAAFPSSGCCNEYNPIMLVRKSMSKQTITELQGKSTGLRDENEKITLKIVPLKEVWKEAARDVKALAALALYEGLTRDRKL